MPKKGRWISLLAPFARKDCKEKPESSPSFSKSDPAVLVEKKTQSNERYHKDFDGGAVLM